MHTAIGDVSLVVEDTARNVQTVVDVMPVMAGQVKAIAEEIPVLSERIMAMREDLRVTRQSLFVSGFEYWRLIANYFIRALHSHHHLNPNLRSTTKFPIVVFVTSLDVKTS
jgi:hypothetical protein